jgi:hypothetical protein
MKAKTHNLARMHADFPIDLTSRLTLLVLAAPTNNERHPLAAVLKPTAQRPSKAIETFHTLSAPHHRCIPPNDDQ